jgi:hypothetical protein
MTRKTNARLAGFTFLLYIAAGVTLLALGGAAGAQGVAAKLARVVCALLSQFSALVLAVTLYRITCDEDRDIALLALTCRVGEGVVGAVATSIVTSASFFAVGSLLFCWLLLRGRMIPIALAWLGVVASVLLVAGLPLQMAGIVGRPVTTLLWVPMAAFEVVCALWLIIKGVAMPATRHPLGGAI